MTSARTRTLDRFDARSLLLFATLTMGGTQAILAQSPPPATPPAQTATARTPAQAFARADANGDGQLTLREAERYPAIAERFQQLDRDQNGSLSPEEFAAGLQQR